MRGAGTSLIALGLILAIGALLYQPTVSTSGMYGVPSETYNLGLLQYQLMFFQAGLASFLAGSFLFGCSAISGRDSRPPEVRSADAASPRPAAPAHAGPEPLNADKEALLAHYGITRHGPLYVYGKYKFASFEDVLREARRSTGNRA